jgi:hypothetical protein
VDGKNKPASDEHAPAPPDQSPVGNSDSGGNGGG